MRPEISFTVLQSFTVILVMLSKFYSFTGVFNPVTVKLDCGKRSAHARLWAGWMPTKRAGST
jgi:hypothetical protein